MKKMICLAIALWVLCVSGCAPIKTVNESSLNRLSKYANSEVVVTKRELPGFEIRTAGSIGIGSLFGVVGAIASTVVEHSEGKTFMISNNIQDPAYSIAQNISQRLRKYGLSEASFSNEIINSDSIDAISAQYRKYPLVLDVKTEEWFATYFSTSWSTYGIWYAATVRLIDTKTDEVILEGACSVKPEKSENSPDYEQMFGGGAQRFKNELQLVIDECVKQLSI